MMSREVCRPSLQRRYYDVTTAGQTPRQTVKGVSSFRLALNRTESRLSRHPTMTHQWWRHKDITRWSWWSIFRIIQLSHTRSYLPDMEVPPFYELIQNVHFCRSSIQFPHCRMLLPRRPHPSLLSACVQIPLTSERYKLNCTYINTKYILHATIALLWFCVNETEPGIVYSHSITIYTAHFYVCILI